MPTNAPKPRNSWFHRHDLATMAAAVGAVVSVFTLVYAFRNFYGIIFGA